MLLPLLVGAALGWPRLQVGWLGLLCGVLAGTKQELSCWEDASGTGCVWLTTGNSWARRVLGETGGDDGIVGSWEPELLLCELCRVSEWVSSLRGACVSACVYRSTYPGLLRIDWLDWMSSVGLNSISL